MRKLLFVAVAALWLFTDLRGATAAPTEDWNDARIAWVPFDRGMETAARDSKPVCLVFYTTWCPHCRNYSRVFHDPRVVEISRQFVMVRVDKDREPLISRRFAPDGEYIPRTFFIAPTGVTETSIHAPRDTFKYFYDENDPASLLAGMREALRRPR